MEIFEQAPIQSILFFILYGVTGVVPLIAALYLLLRRGNAIAPEITPPVRLRRWAAAFFSMVALGHVWWLLFYFYSRDLHFENVLVPSATYVTVIMLDCVTLLSTLAGTLLSMLQDRQRRIWPVFVAMIPFVTLGIIFMVRPSHTLMLISTGYILSLYVLFSVYMVFALRRYGRWLNDNYADLENKKVWLSLVVMLFCLLLLILNTLVDVNAIVLMYLMHFTELVLFGLLLWRVETLPSLTLAPIQKDKGVKSGVRYDASNVEQLLDMRCVATQLYLKHDISLQQLARALGTNRSYLSQYFSSQGITYNTYINNLRINHFISRYREIVTTGEPFTVQQLASDCGYRSYSTFSLAFKQRTGRSVTAWMSESGSDTIGVR